MDITHSFIANSCQRPKILKIWAKLWPENGVRCSEEPGSMCVFLLTNSNAKHAKSKSNAEAANESDDLLDQVLLTGIGESPFDLRAPGDDLGLGSSQFLQFKRVYPRVETKDA